MGFDTLGKNFPILTLSLSLEMSDIKKKNFKNEELKFYFRSACKKKKQQKLIKHSTYNRETKSLQICCY